MESYSPLLIEKKWQRIWEKNAVYKTPKIRNSKFEIRNSRKKYVLDMFPYPSGAVLHVGHMEGYVGTDIVSRYLRMKGYAVLHPMGWDAFGLPAENYAIKTGIHPDKSTHDNIDTFRRQLKMLGLSYDWEREVDTSSPQYYKWTQWLFTVLFKMGLAYKKLAPVNFCPSCGTVLANEQVEDGKCERCGTEVVQKELDQWFLKITAYADALIDGLDTVDWPKSTKLMQKSWIGRKEGLLIQHKVKDLDLVLEAFTAYPAWIWADTFFVISPSHPLVTKLVEGLETKDEVLKFCQNFKKNKRAKTQTKVDDKEGVFTGRYVFDPVTGRELPIWLANFALMDFGTGMIRCSAHDPRDLEFATKYGISLQEVVNRKIDNPVNAHDNEGVLRDSGPFSGRKIDNQLISEVCDWVMAEGFGKKEVTYHLRDWLVSRQRYWGAPIPMIFCQKCQWQPVALGDLPVLLPTDVDFQPKGESPIAKSKSFRTGVKCPNCGGPAVREVDTMDTFVDSSWYFLRFIDPNNKKAFADREKIKEWMPVDIYVGGGHTVQHLLFARFFQKALVSAGLLDESLSEPFTKLVAPGWILGPDSRKMSKRWNNVITPDEVVAKYGADTMRLYEMFMAPFEVDKSWNVSSVSGVYRFLRRFYNKFLTNLAMKSEKSDPVAATHLDRLVLKVAHDIETFNFNTVVSALMQFYNVWEKSQGLSFNDLEKLAKILAPLVPHLSEELWQRIHNSQFSSVHRQLWPEVDNVEDDDTVTIAVQVDGKVRDTIKVQKSKISREAGSASGGKNQRELQETASRSEKVAKYLENKSYRTIYVAGKVINFVLTK